MSMHISKGEFRDMLTSTADSIVKQLKAYIDEKLNEAAKEKREKKQEIKNEAK